MCSPSLGESTEPASKRRKIKSILLLFTMCSLFTPRETPDVNTKHTRITSVIFPPYAHQTHMKKNETKHHNTVFLNTKTWEPHPNASPEGPRTTPYEKYQRWSVVRPLGAAMRLTALRQPPKDASGPKHTRQMNSNPTPKDLYSPPFCDNKHIPTYSKKGGRAGLHAAQYGGAV